MLKRILVPHYIMKGVLHNHTGFPRRYSLYAADCETVNGEPDTLQICDGREVHFFDAVDRENVLDTFLDFFRERVLEHQANLVYFHNLQFDISVLLIKYHALYLGRRKLKIDHPYRGGIVEIEAVIASACFATIRFPDGTKLRLLDSALFVKGSLASVAETLKLKHKKFKAPEGLGERKMRSAEFIAYATNDAWVQYDLATWIVGQHEQYAVRLCVSIAQFAARVFRHHFVKSFETIETPGMPIINASVLSYHGGKNGYYVDGVTVIEDCVEVDITSAYPYAMYELPNFVAGYYRSTDRFIDQYEGVYLIDGVVNKCVYPLLYDHAFKPAPPGLLRDTWVSSYELREAVDRGEFELRSCRGYVWVPDDRAKHNPLKDYVEHFFKLKSEAKNHDERYIYKLLLNSLYGKFIQAIELEDRGNGQGSSTGGGSSTGDASGSLVLADGETMNINDILHLYKAGGLFNPFIATLITGHTRRYLHRLEHKYKALHASTDSVKMLGKHYDGEKYGLGGYEFVVRGRCIMFRNKLYLHYDEAGKLKKYALHGFTGGPRDLEGAFKRLDRHYRAKHMWKVREALRQKNRDVKALSMQYVDRELDVDFSKVTYIDKYGHKSLYTGSVV